MRGGIPSAAYAVGEWEGHPEYYGMLPESQHPQRNLPDSQRRHPSSCEECAILNSSVTFCEVSSRLKSGPSIGAADGPWWAGMG